MARKLKWYHLTKAQIEHLENTESLKVEMTLKNAVQASVYMAQNWGNVPSGIARSQAKSLRALADMIDSMQDIKGD